MTNLKHTSDLVKALLTEDERCRNSDSFLYLRVLCVIADRKGITLGFVNVPNFFLHMHGTEFPIFESVRRARQKLQEHHPELRACQAVEEVRMENEREYRAFARSEA